MLLFHGNHTLSAQANFFWKVLPFIVYISIAQLFKMSRAAILPRKKTAQIFHFVNILHVLQSYYCRNNQYIVFNLDINHNQLKLNIKKRLTITLKCAIITPYSR